MYSDYLLPAVPRLLAQKPSLTTTLLLNSTMSRSIHNGQQQDVARDGVKYDYSDVQHSGSASPDPHGTKFKRNYRACLNCRVRKVKCDLGPVDSPRDGKCARCLRERKDCVFVDSRRGGAENVSLGRQRGRKDEDKLDQAEYAASGQYSSSGAIPQGQYGYTEYPRYQTEPSESRSGELGNMRPEDHGRLGNTRRQGELERQLDAEINPHTSTNPPHNDSPKSIGSHDHFSTMEGALVFLAKAAGTIAKADERDNIDAREKHEQIEAKNNNNEPSLPNVLNPSESQSPASNTTSSRQSMTSIPSQVPSYIPPSNDGKRMSMPAAESGYSVRPKASNKLSSIDYIGGSTGILTEDEAEKLIYYFFTTMHPFFPHLPRFLHSPKVLPGYPILLCAILTISSRYHAFENNVGSVGGGVPRNIEVHDRLWLYVQRLISQTVWAEASTRSIGTIFAFLLFTEWNPRAIHWRWSDYANKGEDEDSVPSGAGAAFAYSGGNSGGSGNVPYANGEFPNATRGNSSNSREFPNATGITPTSPEVNLAGLGAMRRSYRMAWMLIGSSVRLAQDMGFMEISAKTFLATHIAEINSVINISRRSMLAHSLSEVDLEEDVVSEEMMENDEDDDYKIVKMTDDDLKRISSEHVMKFTLSQKAQIELLQIMSLGHESLYGYRAQLGSLTQRQNLSVLNIISPLINNWGRKYRQFLTSTSSRLSRVSNLSQHWLNPNSKISRDVSACIETESFIFEFNYVKLYIYSLALSPSPKALVEILKKEKKLGKVTLKLDEISKSAKYIEQAFNSANEMLQVAHRVHRLKMLRFMPVRWLTRMVRAVAFIVKCYLTITAHKKSKNATSLDNFDLTILSMSLITIDDIILSIQKAAITLRDCSPDELHLCTRYSNVLMYLCSEMKSNSKNFNEDEEPVQKKSKMDYYPGYLGYEENSQNGEENFRDGEENFLGGTPGEAEKFPTPGVKPPSDAQPRPDQTQSPFENLVGDSEVMDWFMNNRNIGLDFVGPWTEMIEQQLNLNDQFNFEDAL